MARKTWLITGCSSGFGAEFTRQLLKRGDAVIATARGDASRLQSLKDVGAHTYSLDVTLPAADIKAKVARMIEEVGEVDVLINNAGYVDAGFVEEKSEESWQKQFDANYFGTVKMTQAILPYFRSRQSGIVALIGSLYGFGCPTAACAAYAGTKMALEALHETLIHEAGPFGIKSIIFEPGICRTEVFSDENFKLDTTFSDPAYDEVRNGLFGWVKGTHSDGSHAGDSVKAVKVMIDVVKGEGVAEGKEMPTRLILGSDSVDFVKDKLEKTSALLKEWEVIGRSIDVAASASV
ncbi:NAD(P)-binding protein [Polyplosphaeria fusca]|uniref:NAD(P)-binding protein n=1 Tax=Polyplosphaeria fusca TaxID=682080 RepID=A0A9P4QNA4_9PLEO|nr:NAD(P)-binding protein [Polyplosphaeria fusca]